jgi:hypothetical protein
MDMVNKAFIEIMIEAMLTAAASSILFPHIQSLAILIEIESENNKLLFEMTLNTALLISQTTSTPIWSPATFVQCAAVPS